MGQSQNTSMEREVSVEVGEELVSTTDTQGIIQYVNDHFCRVSGFSREELIGQHHNIVRHPDMPKAAFADMWGKLKAKQAWRGAVKNRCKEVDIIGSMHLLRLFSKKVNLRDSSQ